MANCGGGVASGAAAAAAPNAEHTPITTNNRLEKDLMVGITRIFVY
jgi:hypothetical protein